MAKLKKVLRVIIESGIFLTIALMPLYLIRVKIWWVPFSLLEIFIYITFVLWLSAKVINKDTSFNILKSPRFKLWAFPILTLLIATTISTLFSVDILISAGVLKGWFLAPLLFLIIVADTTKTQKQIKNIIYALLTSALVVGLIAYLYFINDFLTFDGRLSAFYLSPNHLAMYLVPIFILSLYLYFVLEKTTTKFFLFLIQVFLLLIIYLTLSYGAWLALALSFLVLFFINLKGKFISRKLIIFILLLFIIAAFFQIPTEKFQNFLHSSRSSFYSRMMVWQSAQLMIKDQPLVGIGPGLFQKYYLDYQQYFEPYLEWAIPQPHNIFLAFWLQTGILGLLSFIWLLIVFFKELTKSFSALSVILMIVMIYILLHGLIDTTYWKNDFSFLFWLIIGLGMISLKARAKNG